jgi:hypothetical protein
VFSVVIFDTTFNYIRRNVYRAALIFVLFTIVTIRANDDKIGHQLPDNVMPTLGCWFWSEVVFEPEGYKPFIDQVRLHSPYNLLTTSLRAPEKEVTDEDVHAQIKAAAIYAQKRGIPMIMDLDVRLARRAFEARYPDELQEMLLLQEVELSTKNSGEIVVRSFDLNDHYTHRTTHYIPLHSSLLRVYSYVRDSNGINLLTLKDITRECIIVSNSKDSVHVRIPGDKKKINRHACALVSFTHLTPDVFAPHLIEFQRKIINQYSDVPLAGVCKDEWGFPPSFDGNPAKNQFWYSKHRALAYAKRTKGRDLLEDCLLMHLGINGREVERRIAINHFMEMSLQRNGDLEDDFYHTVKEVFGSNAVVATHPTWWPYPDLREFKKNGLDWWIATRDWAQTDELTPFAVRSALAKKWSSPVWYNMYYSKHISDYERSIWSAVLGGGRINYHPPYPVKNPDKLRNELLRGNLMRAESRVRLLNYISQSPLDCPVAVIFGHSCAMNWAGPGYNDVGMEVADNFWREGFPADLIPSSEIENKNLYINEDGWICYGAQRYAAVLLYHPEFEKSSTADFFNNAAKGPTKLFRVGDWTQDFNGQVIDGNAALPQSMADYSDTTSVATKICRIIGMQNIEPQSSASDSLKGFSHVSSSPPTTGFCRLIDGTIIQIAGTDNVAGDPIQSNIIISDYEVSFDAIGVAAIRLDDEGRVEALAAGGLKYIKTLNFEISLDERVDMALWKDEKGKLKGLLQDWDSAIPASLLAITQNWRHLDIPVPLIE